MGVVSIGVVRMHSIWILFGSVRGFWGLVGSLYVIVSAAKYAKTCVSENSIE